MVALWDVLRLAARGLTTKEIAESLFISAKTTDHHIQHIYNKIGVSTRAAAAPEAASATTAGRISRSPRMVRASSIGSYQASLPVFGGCVCRRPTRCRVSRRR